MRENVERERERKKDMNNEMKWKQAFGVNCKAEKIVMVVFVMKREKLFVCLFVCYRVLERESE